MLQVTHDQNWPYHAGMKTYVIDLAERILSTFIGTFATALLASGPTDLVDLSTWQSAGLAGAAAVISLVKGILAVAVGDKWSASLTRSV